MKQHEPVVEVMEGDDEAKAVTGQAGYVKQEDVALDWITPGALIAERVAHLKEVRFVAERLEGGRYAVFVILDEDPDSVLDTIFETEAEVMKQLSNVEFDLRVRKPHPDWSPDNLLSSCAKHYTRP